MSQFSGALRAAETGLLHKRRRVYKSVREFPPEPRMDDQRLSLVFLSFIDEKRMCLERDGFSPS
jgi:hypothetical protein